MAGTNRVQVYEQCFQPNRIRVLRGAGRQVRGAGVLRVVKANRYRFPRELVVTAFVKWWKVSVLGVINKGESGTYVS